MALDKRSQVSLTLNHGLIRLNISSKYYKFGLNIYRKNKHFKIFPIGIRNQIRPCHKLGQGQPRFIICAILVGPTSQCYIPSPKAIGILVPEMRIFEGFLPYIGMVAILVM